ncbi:hypothetical protein Tco_1014265, partial [Tanacetum coccineum]
SNAYDFIQERLNADKILAEKLQKEEREKFTIDQRVKFLHDTIATQRKFFAQQRSEAIRNKPPTRNQLRNQMMTYLKHVGGKKHSELKTKTYEEIQVLYEILKRQDQNFVAIGSAEDERQIKELNKDPKNKRLKKRVVNETSRKEDTAKGTIDSEIIETKSFIARLHKVSSPDGNYLIVYRVNGHFRAFNYLMEVLHIFDRHYLFHLEITPEDIELILWGDLKIMMESSTEENDQELKDGTIIYMLVERRYPLSKELLQQMIDLGLEVEEENTTALQLDQTVLGKDYSNMLIADSLLKTIWFINAPCYGNEALASPKANELTIPEQTATGKGTSNPLMAEVKTASTPMETQKPLLKDEDNEEVDVHMYRSMIGSLMHLTSSRPDIMFAVCACARYQVTLKVSHLHAVKRIFRYLKGQPKLGLWYLKDSPFDLVAYTDSDYARASLDRKSTTGEQFWSTVKAKTVNGEVQLQALVDGKKIIITESTVRRDLQLEDAEGVDCLPNSTIFEQLTLMSSKTTAWNKFSSTMASTIICLATNQKFNFSKYIFENQAEMGEGSVNPTNPYYTPTFIQPSTSQPQKKQKPRKPNRKDTQIPQFSGPSKYVADEAVYKELDDSLVRAATTASSLEAEQDSGNVAKTRSKETPNESSSLGTTSGGGPKCQETIGDTIAQTRFENVSKHFNDPLLARGNTLQSGKDSLKLNELMELCTNLQTRVLDLEKTKTTQAEKIVSLKRRVKKLEQKKRSRTHRLKRINAINADEYITLVNDQDDADMFDLNTLTGDEVLAEQEVATKDVNLTVNEVTLAKVLAALKSVKSKVKGDFVEEPSVPVSAISTKVSAVTTTTTATIPTLRKGIVITELEHEEPLKKKDQLKLDEEIALKLQAGIDEDERLTREKDEATIALTKE